ncbi:hypothetical protein D3C84_1144430 [compost metagenome]
MQVGRAVFIRRRAYGDELQLAKAHPFGGIGAEVQAPFFVVAPHHGLEAGLEDGDDALLQVGDLLRIHIDAHHLVADIGQASTADQTDIAGPKNSNFHWLYLSR